MRTAPGPKPGFRQTVLGGLKSKPSSALGFRMLPMIDVLFLLLIFFILTAQFRPQESFLPFQLPGSSAEAAAIKADPLAIMLVPTRQGMTVTVPGKKTIAIDDAASSDSIAAAIVEVGNILKAQSRTAGDPIELVCDRKLKWQYIARFYNGLFGIGVRDITFRMAD